MKEEKQRELVVNVSACNGRVTQEGYDKTNKGMVCFYYGGGSYSLRGESYFLVRMIVSDLENSLAKRSGIKAVRFEFPRETASLPICLDGYFGRPVVISGATFLKPLPERRKTIISREINKISFIKDRWGKGVELIA